MQQNSSNSDYPSLPLPLAVPNRLLTPLCWLWAQLSAGPQIQPDCSVHITGSFPLATPEAPLHPVLPDSCTQHLQPLPRRSPRAQRRMLLHLQTHFHHRFPKWKLPLHPSLSPYWSQRPHWAPPQRKAGTPVIRCNSFFFPWQVTGFSLW